MQEQTIYATQIFLKYGLSDKSQFPEDEFFALSEKYPQIQELQDKEDFLQQVETIISDCTTQLASIALQLDDIGDVPVDRPVSLAERYGWTELRKQQLALLVSKNSLQSQLDGANITKTQLDGDVSSLKVSMAIEGGN